MQILGGQVRIKSLLIGLLLLFGFTGAVQAENYTYKIYNHKTNKTVSAELGTLSVSDAQYIFAFFLSDGTPYCAVKLDTDLKDGLVGGKCGDFNTFIRMFVNHEKVAPLDYGWREYHKNTFYPELNSLKVERAAQGKYFAGGN